MVSFIVEYIFHCIRDYPRPYPIIVRVVCTAFFYYTSCMHSQTTFFIATHLSCPSVFSTYSPQQDKKWLPGYHGGLTWHSAETTLSLSASGVSFYLLHLGSPNTSSGSISRDPLLSQSFHLGSAFRGGGGWYRSPDPSSLHHSGHWSSDIQAKGNPQSGDPSVTLWDPADRVSTKEASKLALDNCVSALEQV